MKYYLLSLSFLILIFIGCSKKNNDSPSPTTTVNTNPGSNTNPNNNNGNPPKDSNGICLEDDYFVKYKVNGVQKLIYAYSGFYDANEFDGYQSYDCRNTQGFYAGMGGGYACNSKPYLEQAYTSKNGNKNGFDFTINTLSIDSITFGKNLSKMLGKEIDYTRKCDADSLPIQISAFQYSDSTGYYVIDPKNLNGTYVNNGGHFKFKITTISLLKTKKSEDLYNLTGEFSGTLYDDESPYTATVNITQGSFKIIVSRSRS